MTSLKTLRIKIKYVAKATMSKSTPYMGSRRSSNK